MDFKKYLRVLVKNDGSDYDFEEAVVFQCINKDCQAPIRYNLIILTVEDTVNITKFSSN